MNIKDCKAKVLEYSQRCYTEQLMAGTSGNLSLLSDDNKIVITPSGMNYMTMNIDDVMVIELDGSIIEGAHKPSSEWPMHAHIYKHMPEVKSVVHTHSPCATSFAVMNEAIPVGLVEMVFFLGGDVRVAPLAMQGSEDVGVGCVEALKSRGACLIQNHGVVCIGKDLPQSYMRAVYTEDAAKIIAMAKSMGKLTTIPDDMIHALLNR